MFISSPNERIAQVATRIFTKALLAEPILNLNEFHGMRAFLVIIGDVFDPSAHRIAPHRLGVVMIQHFGYFAYVTHPR